MKASSLHRYMDHLVESLAKLIPRAVEQWDEEAIHDARVATRRLRAVLGLLEPVLPAAGVRRMNKTLRKLRRRLGPLRDADVMLGHLGKVDGGNGQEVAVKWVREQLTRERDLLRQECQQKLSASRSAAKLASDWRRLREKVKRLSMPEGRRKRMRRGLQACRGLRGKQSNLGIRRGEAGETPTILLSRQLPAQLAAFAGQAERLSDALERGGSVGEPEDPHAVRIAGKLLRYTLELTPVVGVEMSPTVLKNLKELQDALGLWHDEVVLSERVLRMALDQGIPYHDQILHENILDMAKHVWQRAQQQLGRFVMIWKERGAQLQRDIGAAFCISPGVEANVGAESGDGLAKGGGV